MQSPKKVKRNWTLWLALILGIILSLADPSSDGVSSMTIPTVIFATFLSAIQPRHFWLIGLLLSLSIMLVNLVKPIFLGNFLYSNTLSYSIGGVFLIYGLVAASVGGFLGIVINREILPRLRQNPKLQAKLKNKSADLYEVGFATVCFLGSILMAVFLVIATNNSIIDITAVAVKFSPDGKHLAVATTDGIEIWSVSSWNISYEKLFYKGVGGYDLDWSSDGHYIAYGPSNYDSGPINPAYEIQVASWPDGVNKFTVERSTSVQFSPDSTRLITVDYTNNARIWSVPDGALVSTIDISPYATNKNDRIIPAVINKNNILGVVNSQSVISLINLQNGQVDKLSDPAISNISVIAFSKNGKLVAAGTGSKTIGVWDIASKKLIQTIKNNILDITMLTFGANDDFLISANKAMLYSANNPDIEIDVTQVSNGALVKTLQGHSANLLSVDFNPANGYLATTNGDGVIRLWKP